MTASCSEFHTLFLSSSGFVYSCGDSSKGKLGLTDIETKYITKPTKIDSLCDILFISCGIEHSICIDCYSIGWAFGCNKYSQLSFTNRKHDYSIPTRITEVTDIQHVSCCENQSAVIDKDNNFWFFGENNVSTKTTSFLTPIIIHSNVKQVVCGVSHVLFLDLHDKLWSCGNNSHGQLGFKGKESREPKIINLDNIIDICCGDSSSLCLDKNGDVWGFGYNAYCQLGVTGEVDNKPTKSKYLTNIKAISCGLYHAMCIDNDNKCYIFGNNRFNKGLKSENSNKPYLLQGLPENTELEYINLGGSQNFCRDIEGNIFRFGCNDKGQLGLGHNNKIKNEIVQMDEEFSFLLSSKSRAKSARK